MKMQSKNQQVKYCNLNGKRYQIIEDKYPIFEDQELIIIEHALDFFKEYRGLCHEDYLDADQIYYKIIKYLVENKKEDLN